MFVLGLFRALAEKLQNNLSRVELLMESYKNQIKVYSDEVKRLSQFEKKYNDIHSKSELMDRIEMLMQAETVRVDEIIGNEQDVLTLKIIIKSLKRELKIALDKRKETQDRLKNVQNDLRREREERRKLEESNTNMESDNYQLMEKFNKIKAKLEHKFGSNLNSSDFSFNDSRIPILASSNKIEHQSPSVVSIIAH